ncbi:RIP metalloprotease RseP [Comamonas humi]
MMLTLIAFVVALAILIAVHEYGHYRVAVACGVKVLRFSIGFGKPLWQWQRPGSPTEFVVSAIPLGGYVRMLDEREAPVDPSERHLAFNNQPLRSRAAIVAAGPLANLLLAVALFASVNWIGVQEPAAVLGAPPERSLAYEAGLRGGEQVMSVASDDGEVTPVRSLEDLRWMLTQAALDGQDVYLNVQAKASGAQKPYRLQLSKLKPDDADAKLMERVGVARPWSAAVLGEVEPGEAAAQAGLQKGDEVLQLDGQNVPDAFQLRERIRASGAAGAPPVQTWQIRRDGQVLNVDVQPRPFVDGETAVGRVGAYIGAPVAVVQVRYGLWEGLEKGAVRTWELSSLTLRMLGKMLIGQASLQNISGPLTIAEYAGKSAQIGFTQYLAFLGLISVSLGVLNLLPLPVLDGGHLMYYLWEAVTGKPPTTAWLERLQKGGIAVLVLMMCVAFFNDLTRLLG